MKKTMIAMMMLGLCGSAMANEEMLKIAANAGCITCHQIEPRTDGKLPIGPAWKDVDRNGCDTRNDILKRDLTNLVFRSGTQNCVVESGTLNDPYSGEVIEFTKGQVSSMEVQIDHVVALADAWQTGAFKLSEAQRSQLANDPLNLLAVKGRLNSQKSDSDAASWLPPNKSYRCAYVARQIAVKYKYGLWVTSAERSAMAQVLSTCPNQLTPAG